MNRLQLFIFLRILQIGFVFCLKAINAYTQSNMMVLLWIFVAVTAAALIINFSRKKSDDAFKLPTNGFFLFFVLSVFLLENLAILAAPIGYIDFETSRVIVIGTEFAFGVCLGVIKKLEIL